MSSLMGAFDVIFEKRGHRNIKEILKKFMESENAKTSPRAETLADLSDVWSAFVKLCTDGNWMLPPAKLTQALIHQHEILPVFFKESGKNLYVHDEASAVGWWIRVLEGKARTIKEDAVARARCLDKAAITTFEAIYLI